MPLRGRRHALQPSLPQTLLDQIDENGQGKKRKNAQHRISRKDARKQHRSDKKKRKAEFFAPPKTDTAKRFALTEHGESPPKKKIKFAAPEPLRNSAKATPKPALKKMNIDSQAAIAAKPQKPRFALEKLASRKDAGSLLPTARSQREQEEDAYISYLEKKLGKGKKIAEVDDGLDDLLDFTSSIGPAGQVEAEPGFSETDSDETRSSEDSEEERQSEEMEWRGINVNILPEGEDDGEDEHEDEEGDKDGDEHEDEDVAPTLLPVPKEDPARYTALGKSHLVTILEEARSTLPFKASRYVPPHLREWNTSNQEESESMVKLKRQLKGLLNRMSEQNMGTILDSIEDLYRKNRRHDLTSTLTTLIIDGISSHSILLDSYVVLHAAFVSSLYKIVGLEFAAYFVQNVVSHYETHYGILQTRTQSNLAHSQEGSSPEGKECSNLIVLLSELYNFQVISSVLVFDIIRDLLIQKLTEFGVDLLLKIVRNSGQQLRQDDPSALKDIIAIVQAKLTGQNEELSSRARFMIETLTNLKNNKVKRAAGQQHQGGEAVERMKKFLSGLAKKRHLVSHEPIRVSLEDLHAAESKGKWWLVGAAWGGDPLMDRQNTQKATEKASGEDTDSTALLKLARKQGMNTDIRRSIFVVLMSSDDYVDACERLSQLNLTEVQQREIIRVILHCCGNEKSYNPYYTLIAQHLCRSSHSYKVTLQFCLWDFFRNLGEMTVGGTEVVKNLREDDGFGLKDVSKTRMRNIARAYGWWIAKDCCTLTVLKPVDFTLIKPRTTDFLKDLFTHLFVSAQVSTPVLGSAFPTVRSKVAVEEMFIKATRVESLAFGLVYFLSKEMTAAGEEVDRELVVWSSKVAIDALRTGMDIVPDL